MRTIVNFQILSVWPQTGLKTSEIVAYGHFLRYSIFKILNENVYDLACVHVCVHTFKYLYKLFIFFSSV